MSFILDALKKSETDRQQRGSAEFAKVPTGSGPARAPNWLLVLGVLLAINLLVLLGLWFRSSAEPEILRPAIVAANDAAPDREPPPADTQADAQATPTETGQPSFANRVAEAKRNQPLAIESDAGAAARPKTEPDSEPSTPLPVASATPAQNTAALPTIFEVIANGSVVLPELHLDIHVYSEVPEDRFVFINMSKQREKSQLSEGPLVTEITPDGVILAYRGKSFLLPRD